LNARLKIVGTSILLCLTLALTVFCAVQTVQAFQRFQQDHKLAVTGDVSTIRSWMTVPFIAHFYHVPETYLDQSLHITDDKAVHHLPLRELADRVKRPVDGLIRDIQHAILNYRNHRNGTGASPIGANVVSFCQGGGQGPGARPYPATKWRACEASQTYRVRAGLAPALVVSPLKFAPVGASPAPLHQPTPATREEA
jgi:hypothetical protein